MTPGTIVLIILILMLVGALPVYGYNASWGYGPSGLVGAFVLLFLILILAGRI